MEINKTYALQHSKFKGTIIINAFNVKDAILRFENLYSYDQSIKLEDIKSIKLLEN